MMENDGNASNAQFSCKCYRWPERLLQQGCLHDRCHCCDKKSFETLGNDKRYTGARSSCENETLCMVCDEAMSQSTAGASDTMLGAGMSFYLGSAAAPKTVKGLLACECCLNQMTAAPQRAAAYFCEDCQVNLLCYECKQSHDKLCGNKHRIMPIDDNDAQRFLDHRWARMPALICCLHKSTCDRWCYSCDTAKCQECILQCAEKFHSISSSDKLDLQSWVGQLQSTTLEVERTCSQFRHVESALELEHRADMLELKRRKVRILNALDSAFSATHEALESSYQETRQRIANVRYCVDSAVSCSRLLTRQPLSSHGLLIRYAQRAIDRHKYTAERLLARQEAALARLSATTLQDDVEDVLKSWLGLPAALTVPGACQIVQSTLCSDNTFRADSQLLCYDIASTFCGHILLAAGMSGLQELDARGFLLDTWLPTSTSASTGTNNPSTVNSRRDLEVVVSVDCTEDDRAVVGLKNACTVVLLKRESNGGSPQWCAQQRFDLGQNAPFAVATRHNMLVVACGFVGKDSRIFFPGKQLVAFAVNTGTLKASTDLDFEIDSVAIADQNVVLVSSHYRVTINPAYKGQFVIESRSSDLQSCMWRVTRDEPILGLAASASGTVLHASVAGDHGRRVLTLDAGTGRLTKVDVANRCIGVPNKVRDSRDLEIKSCTEINSSFDVNTAASTPKIANVVGQNYISTSGGTHHEHWLTSNTVYGKLSCSKSMATKLVALGLNSNIVFHLHANFEQPSLKDSQRRAMSLTVKYLTTFLCIISCLVQLYTITVFGIALTVLPVHQLHALCIQERLIVLIFYQVMYLIYLTRSGSLNGSSSSIKKPAVKSS